jgi:1-acyl-sn-glycerol-3-phosphate acyltransferase
MILNHESYLDWLVIHAWVWRHKGLRIHFLAKDSLFRHPVWSSLVQYGQSVRVSDDGNKILDRQGFKALRRASHIAVFPEGTRSSDGLLGPVHPGAVQLAARLGVPLLPVHLHGFYEAWPRHRRLPRPHPCRVVFRAPVSVPPSVVTDRDAAQAFTWALLQDSSIPPA